MIEFKGECIGVRLVRRGTKDKHICFNMLIEDDEFWSETNFQVSSAWIDETIEQLKLAKEYMRTQTPDMHRGQKYGYKFKQLLNTQSNGNNKDNICSRSRTTTD